MNKVAVVVGKHYWLTFNECRVPLIIKIYNVERSGLIGGLLYNGLTGEVSFSKGFHPQGPAWNEFNTIPEEDERVEVKKKNIYGVIEAYELRGLQRIARARIDDFFDSDTSRPLSKKI